MLMKFFPEVRSTSLISALIFLNSVSFAHPVKKDSYCYQLCRVDTVPSCKKIFSESDWEMDKVAKQLESIDWKKINKQIDESLQTIDFKKIKEETRRAMQQANENIDFKKMQDMIQQSLNEVRKSIKHMNQFSATNPEHIREELRKNERNQTI